MVNFSEKHYDKVIVLIAVIFLFLYLFFISMTWLKAGPIFSMPDENVNYFFTKLYAENGLLEYPEPLNALAENKIHPRSFNVVGGNLVPVGFLGLILFYGSLASVFSLKILPFLTPIFSIIAVICFYFLIKKIFTNNLALLTGLFLFILPGYAYYAGRSMVSNVLFLSLVIISLAGFVIGINVVRKLLRPALIMAASILIGLAFSVRTVEGLWLAPIFIALAIIWRKKIRWHEIVIFIGMILLVFIPVLYHNQEIYGHWWASGYASFENGQVEQSIDISKSEIMEIGGALNFSSLIFPFGINVKNILINFYQYIILFNWWYFIPFCFGFIYFIVTFRARSKKEKVYFWLFVFVMFWLNIFYGSWRFFDNPDQTQYSIGTSYVRYFLPVYIMWLPFVVLGFKKIYSWLIKINLSWGMVLFLFLISYFIWQSLGLVFFRQQDSLVPLGRTVVEYKMRRDSLMKIVPADAVLLTKRAEKFLYPERKVIFYTDLDFNLKTAIKRMLEKKIEIYYYGMIGEEDGTIMEEKFYGQKIIFKPIDFIFRKEKLYKLELND